MPRSDGLLLELGQQGGELGKGHGQVTELSLLGITDTNALDKTGNLNAIAAVTTAVTALTPLNTHSCSLLAEGG